MDRLLELLYKIQMTHNQKDQPQQSPTKVFYSQTVSAEQLFRAFPQHGGSLMLLGMLCWEILGPAIHVDLFFYFFIFFYIYQHCCRACKRKKNIFPDGCCLIVQDNTLCHTAKWFSNGLRSTTRSFRRGLPKITNRPRQSENVWPSLPRCDQKRYKQQK